MEDDIVFVADDSSKYLTLLYQACETIRELNIQVRDITNELREVRAEMGLMRAEQAKVNERAMNHVLRAYIFDKSSTMRFVPTKSTE